MADPFDELAPLFQEHANIGRLAPYLKRGGLLTEQECQEVIERARTLPKARTVEKLLIILKQKGPKSFTVFCISLQMAIQEQNPDLHEHMNPAAVKHPGLLEIHSLEKDAGSSSESVIKVTLLDAFRSKDCADALRRRLLQASDISMAKIKNENGKSLLQDKHECGDVMKYSVVESECNPNWTLLHEARARSQFCPSVEVDILLHHLRLNGEYSHSTASLPESYYSLPALTNGHLPTYMLQKYHFLQCPRSIQFLQRLVLKLAFQLSLARGCADTNRSVLRRKCQLWRSGVALATENGDKIAIDVHVIVFDQSKALLMSCLQGNEVAYANLLSFLELMQTESFPVLEFPTLPPHLSMYPLSNTNELVLYNRAAVVKAKSIIIQEGSPTVVASAENAISLEKAVHLKPYTGIDVKILHHLPHKGANSRSTASLPESYYSFPALTNGHLPTYMVQKYHFLQCSRSVQFLRRLVLKLAFQLSLARGCADTNRSVLRRKWQLWRSGVALATENGNKIAIDVIVFDQSNTLLMSCLQGNEVAYANLLLSFLMQKSFKTQAKSFPVLATNEFPILPSCLSAYLLSNANELVLYDLYRAAIMKAISIIQECSPIVIATTISLEKALHLKPYTGVDAKTLHHLFEKNTAEQRIIVSIFADIAKWLYPKHEQLCKMLCTRELRSLDPYENPIEVSSERENVCTSEFLIDSSDLHAYPLYTKQLTLYSIAEIARAAAECMPRVVGVAGARIVQLEINLYFEPHELLFSRENVDEVVSNSFLLDLALVLYPKMGKQIEHASVRPRSKMLGMKLSMNSYYDRVSSLSEKNPVARCFRLLLAWRDYDPGGGTYGSLCSTLDKHNFFVGRNMLLSPEINPAFSTASVKEYNEKAHQPHHQYDRKYPGVCFLGDFHHATVMSEAQELKWEGVGLSISIPAGAIPKGNKLNLRVRQCLTGPFTLPEDYELASPVYLITPHLEFSKEVELSIELYCNLQSQEDCESMTFLIASSTPTYDDNLNPHYNFTEVRAGRAVFQVGEKIGRIALQHFCKVMVGRKRKHSDGERPTLQMLLAFPTREGTLNIPELIGTKYTELSILLLEDDDGTKVAALESQYRGNAEKINIEILREWIRGRGKQPVIWKTLVEVLREIRLNALADSIAAVRPARDSLYSVRLYRSKPPFDQNGYAIFTVSLLQEVYIKNLNRLIKERFPSNDFDVVVHQPVQMTGDDIELVLPREVPRWRIIPDRTPPRISQEEINPPLYGHFTDYPPRIGLALRPETGAKNASCSISVRGFTTDFSFPVILARQKGERPTLRMLLAFPTREGTLNIPELIGTKYFQLGIFLLEDDMGVKVEALENQYRDNAEKINIEILRKWIHGRGKQPVIWRTLVEVLREIGLNALADSIAAVKYTEFLPQQYESGEASLPHPASDILKSRLDALAQAIKGKECVNLAIVQGIFMGISRSGKSSLMKRLIGWKPERKTVSTGVAEKAVQLYIKKAVHICSSLSESDSESESFWCIVGDLSEESVFLAEEVYLHESKAPDKNWRDSKHLSGAQRQDSQPESAQQVLLQETKKFFEQSYNSTNLSEVKVKLQGNTILYLTDCGGQLLFQEVLPAIVSGPSLFFLVFKLTHDFNLNSHFEDVYEDESKGTSIPEQSSCTLGEYFLQSLASIASNNFFKLEEEGDDWNKVPIKPKVVLVGTHKDEVDEETIAKIDHDIRQLVENEPFSDMIFEAPKHMMFTIDNFSEQNEDVRQIRKAIEDISSLSAFKVSPPVTWLLTGLELRRHDDDVLSFEDCLQKAKTCGIGTEKELDDALFFHHTQTGMIRHYVSRKYELHKIVIVNPGYLFRQLSALIGKRFTFKFVHNTKVDKLFAKAGIFTAEFFQDVIKNRNKLLTSRKLLELLQHLYIIACLPSTASCVEYFMPSVCAIAKLDEAMASTLIQQTSPPLDLFITFERGYCPRGLFASLVAHLIQNKTDLQWYPLREKIFRYQICLRLTRTTKIVLSQGSRAIRIHISSAPTVDLYGKVKGCIQNSVEEVSQTFGCKPIIAIQCQTCNQEKHWRLAHECEDPDGKYFSCSEGHESPVPPEWFPEEQEKDPPVREAAEYMTLYTATAGSANFQPPSQTSNQSQHADIHSMQQPMSVGGQKQPQPPGSAGFQQLTQLVVHYETASLTRQPLHRQQTGFYSKGGSDQSLQSPDQLVAQYWGAHPMQQSSPMGGQQRAAQPQPPGSGVHQTLQSSAEQYGGIPPMRQKQLRPQQQPVYFGPPNAGPGDGYNYYLSTGGAAVGTQNYSTTGTLAGHSMPMNQPPAVGQNPLACWDGGAPYFQVAQYGGAYPTQQPSPMGGQTAQQQPQPPGSGTHQTLQSFAEQYGGIPPIQQQQVQAQQWPVYFGPPWQFPPMGSQQQAAQLQHPGSASFHQPPNQSVAQYGDAQPAVSSNAVKICDVLKKSDFRPSSWRGLAARLNISDPDSIATRERPTSDLCLQETIHRWLQNEEQATWPKLANEVSRIESYGNVTKEAILRNTGVATHSGSSTS